VATEDSSFLSPTLGTASSLRKYLYRLAQRLLWLEVLASSQQPLLWSDASPRSEILELWHERFFVTE